MQPILNKNVTDTKV